MKTIWVIVLTSMLTVAPVALAETVPGGHEANASAADVPRGASYRVGDASNSSEVPLRDYLSSRIDQLRAEMLDRIDTMEKAQREIMDERDKQYAQRFAAQQEALTAALQAAKEAVANALSAAKEAVTKAEDASNKRFDSVNEFRKTLTDQTATFISKDAFDARVKALEDKTTSNTDRLNNIQAEGAGANSLWGWIAGAVGIILVFGNFAMNYNRSREPTARR